MKRPIKKQRDRDLDEDDLGIRPVSKIKRPRSWAIYGRSGTGKTTFAGTFPTPALLLDCRDEGTDSVMDVKGLDVKDIEDWDDLVDIYYFLKKNPKKYKTVIIDTVTMLQQLCLIHVLEQNKKGSSRAGDWGTLTKREWGDASAMLKEQITNFRDLPLETVFLAQERVWDDDDLADTGILVPEAGPAMMKSVATHLNAAVSIIGQTHIVVKTDKKEVKGKTERKKKLSYRMRLVPNEIYTAKIRKPKSVEVPEWITDPTYEDIIDIIEGE